MVFEDGKIGNLFSPCPPALGFVTPVEVMVPSIAVVLADFVVEIITVIVVEVFVVNEGVELCCVWVSDEEVLDMEVVPGEEIVIDDEVILGVLDGRSVEDVF